MVKKTRVKTEKIEKPASEKKVYPWWKKLMAMVVVILIILVLRWMGRLASAMN